MPELSFNEIERNREIARGIETYRRQDIVQREKKEEEKFISERADIKRVVLELQRRHYSRYLENEKPKIEVIA
ncbi:MAG: hypothetical protein MUF61_01710 [archaeon]|nr:hypothetical protein [archaeon]